MSETISSLRVSLDLPFCPLTAAIRKVFVDQPAEFDPRKYLGPARDELKRLYKHKCENVLGSAGKA